MGRDNEANTSFLHDLLHDTRANTLAIAAAAMVPLMAMVGGGVDASRYYMTAARMQAACDAGALAARRAMTDDTFTTAHRTVGLNFFDQNFNDGMFGSNSVTRDYTSDGQGKVIGTAIGNLDTAIMGAFGYDEFNISVSCTAEINISNTDIMFVLDVTGSMADCPDGSNCNSGPGSKIVALRSAVVNFYDTVEDATSASAQVRYGFVPYSQQVNVGFQIPREFMADRHTYQSRVARYNPAPFPNADNPDVDEIGDTIVISDQVEWLPRSTSNLNSTNQNHYRFRTDGSAGTNARNFCLNTLPNTYVRTINGQQQTWQVFAPTEIVLNQWPYAGSYNNLAGCRGRVRKTRLATAADIIPSFREWVYCPVDTGGGGEQCGVSNPARSPAGWESVDLSTLYDDNRIDLPIGTNGAMTSVTWAGCIEEPGTALTDNYSPIPDDAFDLDINLVPENESQMWKPALIDAVWKREDGSSNTLDWLTQTTNESRPGWSCPRAARRLAEITRNEIQTYVAALTPAGNTYHDLGMIWGARFIAPRGMFRADNESAPNGDAIARHIVFMTDGAQVNNVENYSTQGIEWWDRRITGDGNSSREFNRRASRLQAICAAARAEGITVWTVSFGLVAADPVVTQLMRDCASPGRDYNASNSAALNEAFQEIAQKIAALRLTS